MIHVSEAAIGAAAFAFEKANGNELGSIESGEISIHGFTDTNPGELVAGLVAGIENDSSAEGNYRRQAYWALGKRRDNNLICFLRERLRIEMTRDPDATYQILIALDNLQEPVFSDGREGLYSVLDEELNLNDARAYLKV